MKKFTSIFLTLSLSLHVFAQRQCGAEMVKAALKAHYPGMAEKLEAQRQSLQSIADNYKSQMAARGAERSTTSTTVPIVFHILVNDSEYNAMGGATGIQARADSQIAVLNRDYNRQNSDSTLIPSGWKHLYASVGTHFGLAHKDPTGRPTPGYEVKIITTKGFSQGPDANYDSAKHNSLGGLDAWDVTKYINVWCLGFTDYPTLLGITVAPSFTGLGGESAANMGICINFLALGKQNTGGGFTFPPGGNYTLGRTLTHEMGHYFEIWHTWGDDGGLCPWNGGSDDGIADTPPEANYKYGNPAYTIPGGTIYDDCRYNGSTDVQTPPYGVACLDFINYTDDNAMHMFTTDQAAVMASQLLPTGESYNLTQNPTLLVWPPNAGISHVAAENSLILFPNPVINVLNITFDASSDELQQVTIVDAMGREVRNMKMQGNKQDHYSIGMSDVSNGIYFLRCTFAAGSITRTIWIQR